MQKKTDKRDKRIEREQGDVNTTENRRKYWERNLADHQRSGLMKTPNIFCIKVCPLPY